MTPTPPSRLAKLVALLLFCGVPVLALALAAANAATLIAGRTETARSRQMLAALDGRLDVLDPKGAVDTSRIYLQGASASLAAADLRTRLVVAIAQFGGQLVETRTIDADPSTPGEDAVSLGATFDIDNAGLARLLYALESGIPLMEVDDLVLRRLDAEGKSENPSLRVELAVRAFRGTPSS